MTTPDKSTPQRWRWTARELIEMALIDAIDWQESLAGAYPNGAPERREALMLAKQYRAIRKRRYGEDRQPIEVAMKDAVPMTIQELYRMAAPTNFRSPEDIKNARS